MDAAAVGAPGERKDGEESAQVGLVQLEECGRWRPGWRVGSLGEKAAGVVVSQGAPA